MNTHKLTYTPTSNEYAQRAITRANNLLNEHQSLLSSDDCQLINRMMIALRDEIHQSQVTPAGKRLQQQLLDTLFLLEPASVS